MAKRRGYWLGLAWLAKNQPVEPVRANKKLNGGRLVSYKLKGLVKSTEEGYVITEKGRLWLERNLEVGER